MAIQQLIAPQQNNLIDTFMQAEQIKAYRSRNAMNDYKMQSAEREVETANRLRDAYASGADPMTDEGVRQLMAAGADPKAIYAAQKERYAGQKNQSQTQGYDLENSLKKVELGAQLLSGVRDEGSYQWAKKRAVAIGLPIDNLPENYDPAFVEQTLQTGMKVKDQLTQRLNEQRLSETQRHNQAGESVAQGNLGIAQAGLEERRQFHNASLGAQESQFQRGQAATQRTTDTALRKEFTSLPAVKNYTTVVPIVQSLREAAGVDNAAADMNLVYGVAKIMDPESVVRESETAMVVSAGSPAQKYQGMFNYVVGGGRLTPETRAQLMNEVESRAKGHEGLYNDAVTQYQSGAPAIGSLPKLDAGRNRTVPGMQTPPPNTSRTPVTMVPPGGQAPSAAQIPAVQSDADYDQLPSGARFTDPQGKVRVKP